MNCTHCQSELTPHDTLYGAKRGALHCDGCGCCFLADGVTPRDGVPVCEQAQAPVTEVVSPSADVLPVEPEPVAEPTRRSRR